MARFWRVFLKVLKSYSLEEKIVSLVLLVAVLVLSFQMALDFFRTPGVFADQKGTYTEGMVYDKPVLINPLYADFSEPNRALSSLIFSGLTRYDPKVKNFVEDMATLIVSGEGTVYTFILKDGLRWHDGEPVTATDVYFTYHDVIQSPDFQNPVLKANFEGVEVRQVNEKSVEFVLKSPNSFFITNLNVGILPKHLLGGVPVFELPMASFNLLPIGTGPYRADSRLTTLSDGRQVILLARNDGYFGEKPSIQNIKFQIFPNSQQLLSEQGAVNVVSRVPKSMISSLEKTGRFQFLSYELPQYTAVFLNMNSPILQKPKVRLALQKALDKDELLKKVSGRTRVDTPLMELNQSEWINKPNLEEAQGALFDSGYKMPEVKAAETAAVTQETVETQPSGETSQTAATQSTTEISATQSTLETAETTETVETTETTVTPAEAELYRQDADGNTLKFILLVRKLDEVPDTAEEMRTLLDFLVESWKKAGVAIEIQQESQQRFEERIAAREYDLLLAGESLGYNFDTYSFWHSSQAASGGLNFSNYRSFPSDALIERIRSTFDSEAKTRHLQNLAGEIARDIPAIFLYRPSYVLATDRKVQGITLEGLAFPSDRFAGIAQWCVTACDENAGAPQ